MISSVRIYCKPMYFNRRVEHHFSSKMTRKSRDFVFRHWLPDWKANKAASNLFRSYLEEKNMETNFEMFDVARLAKHSPIFIWTRVQKVEIFTKPQH